MIDDFGCQRVKPERLLNRWIHPLENGVDFLTLQTGQQVAVPFRQMIIVSTNQDPRKIMTPAFLRRFGYRLHVGAPDQRQYAEIFRRCAAGAGVPAPEESLEVLMQRYASEGRPLRGCEPRDLIETARDICRFEDRPLTLDSQTLHKTWEAYFGASEDTSRRS